MAHPSNDRVDRWLAQEDPEPVLEPELSIVDPHHHLWDLRPTSGPLVMFEQKVFLCEEMSDEIARSGHRVVQTVFAQCLAFHRADGPVELRPVGETEFANGVAAMSRSGLYGPARLCTGIFSTADLHLGKDVEPVLRAHLAASPNFRGIRFFGPAMPQGREHALLEGCAVLASHGLSLDHYSPVAEHSRGLVRIADAHPDLTIIANHLAGGRIDPDATDAEFAQWRELIDTLASRPNLVMKLGGAQMRVGAWEPPFHMNRRAKPIGSEELAASLYRWYAHALAAFGPDRCMFESNFPVDRECVSYRTLWNAFKRIAAQAGLRPAEKAQVFSGTAARAYRLTVPA